MVMMVLLSKRRTTVELGIDGVRVLGGRVPLDDDRVEFVALGVAAASEIGTRCPACENEILIHFRFQNVTSLKSNISNAFL
jgi:hypothetical protein